jgi:hypothetical protein
VSYSKYSLGQKRVLRCSREFPVQGVPGGTTSKSDVRRVGVPVDGQTITVVPISVKKRLRIPDNIVHMRLRSFTEVDRVIAGIRVTFRSNYEFRFDYCKKMVTAEPVMCN